MPKLRRDATVKKLDGEARKAVLAWLEEDGWQSCCQRIFSELGIASPKDATKPVGKNTLYDAVNYWAAQEISDEMFCFRDAQVELMAKFKPGDAKVAREFGEFALLQRANKTQNEDIFTVATSAQDSRRRLDLEEQSGKTKAEIAFAKLSQKDRDHLLAREKFEFDAAKAVLAKLAELKTIARDRALSEDDKITQVRLRLWGPDPLALEGPKA